MIVKSAGFVNPGRRAAKKMRDAAGRLGYDLAYHRSQLVTKQLLRWADVVLYMDAGNLWRIKEFPKPWPELHCLGGYADPPVPRIPDPAFMAKGSKQFRDVVAQICSASQRAARELV